MAATQNLALEIHETEERLLGELRNLRKGLRQGGKLQKPAEQLTVGQKVADKVAATMGSWPFIIVQSAILLVWIVLNVTAFINKWDPYPFILLNLALSFQAAYAAPFIMMSQNRQQDIDRKEAENDHQINVKAELEIELLHEKVDALRQKEVLMLTQSIADLTDLLKAQTTGVRRQGLSPRSAAPVSAFLACDWGGTNLRAWVVGDGGEVLDRRDFPFGISRLQPGEAVERFRIDVRPALAAEDLPAILCGMVGSNLGWRAVGYLDCPVDLSELGRHLRQVQAGTAPAWIVPGLRGPGLTGAPDFMRGEETQVLGWLRTTSRGGHQAVLLPGTHAKWVGLEDQRLVRVITFMTGELYGVLSRHSVLRTEGEADNEAAFDAGLAAAGDGGALAARLFSTRTRVVAGGSPAAADSSASYLSGLLIGAEVAAAPALAGLGPDESIVLLGDLGLCRWYARALRRAGRAFEVFDGDRAVLAGLIALWRAGPGSQA